MLDIYTFYDIIITLLILLAFTIATSVSAKYTPYNKKPTDKDKEKKILNMLAICDNIFWGSLSSNHYAVELLRKRFEYEKSLSVSEYNRLPFYHKLNWVLISANQGAIELIKERIKYEESLGDEYVYQGLPNHNRDTLNKINWQYMTSNQNAVELLRERIKYEKTLPLEKYNKLNNKIDWINNLGGLNKNAIILLQDLLIE